MKYLVKLKSFDRGCIARFPHIQEGWMWTCNIKSQINRTPQKKGRKQLRNMKGRNSKTTNQTTTFLATANQCIGLSEMNFILVSIIISFFFTSSECIHAGKKGAEVAGIT